jgi:hypothetical protein
MNGGGFENAPNTFSKKFVSIDFFYGECYLKSGSKKIPLEKTASEEGGYLIDGKKSSSWKKVEELNPIIGVVVKDGDSLITGKNGYVIRISYPSSEDINEERSISLFPNSEIILRIKTVKKTKNFTNPNGKTGVMVLEMDIIEGFELVKGLFNVSVLTSKELANVININSKYPKISFKPNFGKGPSVKSLNMNIELLSDGSIVILNLFGYNVIHEKSGIEAKTFDTLAMVANPKITVTQSNIYLTDLSKYHDYRAEEINKRMRDLAIYNNLNLIKKSHSEQISKETLEKSKDNRLKQIKQELANEKCKSKPNGKIIAFLEKQLLSSPEVLVSNETKSTYNKFVEQFSPSLNAIESPLPSYSAVNESDKVAKSKDVKRTVKNYDTLVGEDMDRQREFDKEIKKLMLPAGAIEMYKRMQAEGKSIPPKIAELIRKMRSSKKQLEDDVKNLSTDKGIVAQTATKLITESLTFKKTLFKFTKLEKGPEINMARAPKGKEFLFIYFDSTNNSTSQQFFSPDDEFRLICNKEVIPLRNYRMETNKDPNKLYSNEQLFFVIPETAKEFTLEIGKKILPKQTVKLKL